MNDEVRFSNSEIQALNIKKERGKYQVKIILKCFIGIESSKQELFKPNSDTLTRRRIKDLSLIRS